MLGGCHKSLKGFGQACSQRMDSHQHFGSTLVSSVPTLSHVSHPPLLHFYTACPQAAAPCHLVVPQSPLETGSSFSKALLAMTGHSAQSCTVCSAPAHEVRESVPHLHYSSFFPQCASQARVGHQLHSSLHLSLDLPSSYCLKIDGDFC